MGYPPATKCSFCEREESQTQALIQGPEGAAICDRCARLAVETADEQVASGKQPVDQP